MLGGVGDDARNLTTLWKGANHPAMWRFEAEVVNAVKAGQTVRYAVTPIYRGSEKIARGITIRATGIGRDAIDRYITVLNLP